MFEALNKKTENVQGWTSFKERKFLYERAKEIKGDGAIVEIGSWKGKSTIWLAQGAKDGGQGKIYAIDHFVGSSEHQSPGQPVWTFDEFKNNIKAAGLEEFVEPIVADSETAVKSWTRPIKFIFIDGAHEYEAVKKDFSYWYPFLAEGGTIALHDCAPELGAILGGLPLFGLAGPRKVAWEEIFSSVNFCRAGLAGSIVYATKCRQRSWGDAWRSQLCWARLWGRNVLYYGYKLLTFLPGPLKRAAKKVLAKI